MTKPKIRLVNRDLKPGAAAASTRAQAISIALTQAGDSRRKLKK